MLVSTATIGEQATTFPRLLLTRPDWQPIFASPTQVTVTTPAKLLTAFLRLSCDHSGEDPRCDECATGETELAEKAGAV